MIHTLELSREISKDTFEQIISEYTMRWDKSSFTTKMFEDQGIPMVRLRKEKGTVSDGHGRQSSKTYYMIYLSINPGKMNGEDPHLPTDLLRFSPDFVKAIYKTIVDTIPCLDNCPEVTVARQKVRDLMNGRDINYEKMMRLDEVWLEKNAFDANRIDFCIDIYDHPLEYLALLNQGYPIREEKSVHLNIYHKETEIREKNLSHDPDTNYDFLRIEIQANKEKLSNLLQIFKIKRTDDLFQGDGTKKEHVRQLDYYALPIVEAYLFTDYINRITGGHHNAKHNVTQNITGGGRYVTYSSAMKLIDQSSHTEYEKEKMKAVIKAVKYRGGIAAVLKAAENGALTDLGKQSTVQTYLNLIHALGINPVTIPARTHVTNWTIPPNEAVDTILPSVIDQIGFYLDDLIKRSKGIWNLTDEDFEAIARLGQKDE